MYLKKFVCCISLILMICLFTGCAGSSLPIYDKTDENGISVTIDGFKYRALPPLKWDINILGEKIGYAGDRDISLYEVEGDTERNFIYYNYNYNWGDFNGVLYRDDIVIPEPSEKTIDEIEWVEYCTKLIGNNVIIEDEYNNIVNDTGIIQELFNAFRTCEKLDIYGYELSTQKDDGRTHVLYINCTSNELPAARYKLNIGIYNDMIVCGNFYEKYIEIPIELIEKIAGKQIDASEFTERLG